MLKKENILLPMIIILKKVISFEKLVIPRLRVFEEICPSSLEWKVITLNLNICNFINNY